MKNKKHDKIIQDYDSIKSKHIEKLTDKILKNDEKLNKLKEKPVNKNFLDLF
jgi:hypothetical protein